ncbi:MAG: hypothetical protein QNK23_08050 [Crocinitomicaceae bacterium]|nr:hypothetical protein [Crocinitomicaceae bacterium]
MPKFYLFAVFKEYKETYAMARKDVGSIEEVWKNLETTSFEELYDPEDDFPEEWK